MFKRFSRSGICLFQGHDLQGSPPAAKTGVPSVARPDPGPKRRPNTSQSRAPRLQSPSCLCSPLPFPSFTFNMGRLACEELTLVSPGFLSRNCFLALTVFCHSFFCHSSAATALLALVRFWLSAPEGPRHLQSH